MGAPLRLPILRAVPALGAHYTVTLLCAPVLDHAQYWTFPLVHGMGLEKEDSGLCGPPGSSDQCRKVTEGSKRRGDEIQWGEWTICALRASNERFHVRRHRPETFEQVFLRLQSTSLPAGNKF